MPSEKSFSSIVMVANQCIVLDAEAFAVCENYSPPEGFNEKDLHRLLEKVGSPSGVDDLGNCCTLLLFYADFCIH